MARREYLSPDERTRSDTPPTLMVHQWLILLDLPVWAETYLKHISTPTNKLGFDLQLGFFRVAPDFSWRTGLTLNSWTGSLAGYGLTKLFSELKAVFTQLAPLIERLALSDDTVCYYANTSSIPSPGRARSGVKNGICA